MSTLWILGREDVRAALPMRDAIDAMKRAYAAYSSGQAQVPLRTRVDVPAHQGLALFMPAYVAGEEEALALKAVTVYNQNPARGLPLIHAGVLVLEPQTGQVRGLLEGGTLTAIRTGAASGAATDVLARPDSRVLAVFGAGTQARSQIEAVCTVRPIERVWIYDVNRGRAEALARDIAGQGPVPRDVRVAESPQQAVAEADVICTATTSSTPVFRDQDLKPGVHINGIGAYTPEMAEVPPETVQRALVVVDAYESAWAEAGDLIQPLQQGLITKDHVYAELGEIILGRKPGRTSPEQITFFKSVGLAVQDAVAAAVALRRAAELGLGQRVAW
ncbi:MAG: ornithine cyclodeaminase family protein [Chloroflexi bacterium]|nr:ornithine cyclodeaminase family protein [Chloroflexota bacterium]